ncbi:MAG: hypothetical protein ACHRXM_26015 [Isosphaerales bacterium]
MARSQFGLVATVLATALAFMGRVPVLAAEGPQNEVLKKHGLKIVGSLSVLETESDVKNKMNEVRRLSKQLNYSIMQQQGTMSAEDYQQTIKNLGAQIDQMRAQINLASQQMASLPRFRGRLSTTMAQEQFNELSSYRYQLQMEVNQETAWLNQLKSQKFDPKSKDKIDAEVRDRREAYHQALLDLRKLADSTTEKYGDLAEDQDVKKAIAAAGKAIRNKLDLGPSHEFLNNVKLLEKLEKAASSPDTDGSPAKHSRRSRAGTKTKHSSKPATATKAAAPTGDSDQSSSR